MSSQTALAGISQIVREMKSLPVRDYLDKRWNLVVDFVKKTGDQGVLEDFTNALLKEDFEIIKEIIS